MPSAKETFDTLERTNEKKHRKVVKTLHYLEQDPRHNSLNTHKYDDLEGPNKETVFEAYAENKTPGAYRVFWFYGPGARQITILAITPHP